MKTYRVDVNDEDVLERLMGGRYKLVSKISKITGIETRFVIWQLDDYFEKGERLSKEVEEAISEIVGVSVSVFNREYERSNIGRRLNKVRDEIKKVKGRETVEKYIESYDCKKHPEMEQVIDEIRQRSKENGKYSEVLQRNRDY